MVVGLILIGVGGTVAWWGAHGTRRTAVVGTGGRATGTTAWSAPSIAPATTAPTSTSTTASTAPTSTTVAPPPATTWLREGASGPEVLALQHRLTVLGYWLNLADGHFGSSTTHAVVAFQKAEGISRDGIVGPATDAALASASRLQPRSSTGRVIEVDLSRQLLLVVVDGRVEWVMDMSTGAVAGSTPTGHFQVFRQVDGYDRSPLGVLYRPKYFNRGIAVHGYPSVPPVPASHGCVRVTDAAIDWLWASNAMPVGTAVWVY